MNNNKIGILFHDNDFSNTFIGVLTTIGESMTWVCEDKESRYDDKKFVIDMINRIAFAHYLMYQSTSIAKERFLTDYLKLDESQVIINEEVDEWKKEDHFLNGEAFFLEYHPWARNGEDNYTVYCM